MISLQGGWQYAWDETHRGDTKIAGDAVFLDLSGSCENSLLLVNHKLPIGLVWVSVSKFYCTTKFLK